MITVHESDTGEYVLRHETTGMVIVDPDLERAYTRLREHLRENQPEANADEEAPEALSASASSSRSIAWPVAVLLLAALATPFVWVRAIGHTESGKSARLERQVSRHEKQIDQMKRRIDDMGVRVNDIHLRLNAAETAGTRQP